MHFLHVLILTGSMGTAGAAAEVISWDAVRAHRMVRTALGEVPAELRPTLRRVSTPIQVQALLLMLGHYPEREVVDVVPLCLEFCTEVQIADLARMIFCDRKLRRDRR